jgi:hypothetical protein
VILMAIGPACYCPTELVTLEFPPGGEGCGGELPEGILADVVLDGFVRALDGFEAVLAGVPWGFPQTAGARRRRAQAGPPPMSPVM